MPKGYPGYEPHIQFERAVLVAKRTGHGHKFRRNRRSDPEKHSTGDEALTCAVSGMKPSKVVLGPQQQT